MRVPDEAGPTRKECVPLKPAGAVNRNETAWPGTYDSTVYRIGPCPPMAPT